MKLIARFRISSIESIPIFLGGPDPNRSDICLRITSFRGVMRWVLRALISAAAYRNGYDENDAVNKLLPEIMGGTGTSSRIILSGTIPLKPIITKGNIREYINFKKIELRYNFKKREWTVSIQSPHQRLTMLWMGISVKSLPFQKTQLQGLYKVLHSLHKKRITVEKLNNRYKKVLYNTVVEFLKRTLKIIERKNNNEISLFTLSRKISWQEKLAVYGFILSVLLFGVGKGTRRGLGSLKIENVQISKDMRIKINYPNDKDTIKEVSKKIERLINDAINIITEELKNRENIRKRSSISRYPSIPSFGKSHIYIIEKNQNENIWESICSLNKILFLRSGKIGCSLRGISSSTDHTKTLYHYILGLPRNGIFLDNIEYYVDFNPINPSGVISMQSRKKDRNTRSGFTIRDPLSERRASPVILSAINERYMVLTVFLSADWPTILRWSSPLNHRKFENCSFENAYSILIQEIYSCLRKNEYVYSEIIYNNAQK